MIHPLPKRNRVPLASTSGSLLLMLAFCLLSTAAEALERATVFAARTEGYNVFRIPVLIRAANGDLLASCEAREGGDASEMDLVRKRSTDGGKTWGPLQIVQAKEPFQSLYPDDPITVGNPAPVVDVLDPDHPGRIWLPFTVENDRVFVTFSDDHGASWSPPREITATVKLPEWGWYATGPVHSIQLERGKHKGRLVVPCDHRVADPGKDRGPNGADGPTGKGRSDLRLRYSLDETKRWQDGPLIHEGPAAYSDMARITVDGGEIGMLFEAGDLGKSAYQRIDFVRIPLTEIVK